MPDEATLKSIRPRTPELPLDAQIPKHWFGGNALATAVADGVNLLFPAGERFFVRSVWHYADKVTDPELRKQVRGFAGQEGRHAHAHERYFDVMRGHGHKIARFLAAYEWLVYGKLEPLMPPSVRLAATAAAEHFTAIMAEGALAATDLDGADPTMRALLLWHAAEEIEHKAVAFDVLQRVNPSYALRLAGLALSTVMLFTFWAIGTGMLLAQDPEVTLARVRRELVLQGEGPGVIDGVLLPGLRAYLRRDFHPSQNDNYHLAERYLASAGLA